ncbi:MAG: hypothetical protein ACK5L8_02555 [Marinicella pacifica]
MSEKLFLSLLFFFVSVQLSAEDKRVGLADVSSGQNLALKRFVFASGGITHGDQIKLQASIGQHQAQPVTNGSWVLHAGIITPGNGWPNDLIFSDSYENNTSGE